MTVELPIRRNTILLAATMAVFSAVVQLVAAVSSLTFVLVTGVEGPARARAGDLPDGLGADGGPRRPGDGPCRAQAGDRLGFVLAAFGCC